jgi:phenolic acid decarboxylase
MEDNSKIICRDSSLKYREHSKFVSATWNSDSHVLFVAITKVCKNIEKIRVEQFSEADTKTKSELLH